MGSFIAQQLHQSSIESQVVGGGQVHGLWVAHLEQVVQIGAGMIPAQLAVAARIHRAAVAGVSVVQRIMESVEFSVVPAHAVGIVAAFGEYVQPLVASLAAEKGILVSVLSADTRDLSGQCYGSMLLKLPKDTEEAKQAAAYMRSQPGVTVEEVTGE